MDQRAKSIQLCKDQISILERKSSVSSSSTDLNDPNVIFLLRTEASCFSCCREKTDGRCGDQFLQLGRVESDSLSKAKPKVPGKTGSLLDEVKTAIGTSTPYVRVSAGSKMSHVQCLDIDRWYLCTSIDINLHLSGISWCRSTALDVHRSIVLPLVDLYMASSDEMSFKLQNAPKS
ncbi:hypothetical protein F2Q69_00048896 [Brassica cretica]|uniref:Uncharacterized protein n=1 Tax=Brassica cretica TaxID=69181 RepID=A0A8S9PS43_BRACR|nr:hypothetical protein F2Q69_00048896 [Brassica cretica]